MVRCNQRKFKEHTPFKTCVYRGGRPYGKDGVEVGYSDKNRKTRFELTMEEVV